MDNKSDAVFVRIASIWIILGLFLAVLSLPLVFNAPSGSPERIFLRSQDLWVLIFASLVLAMCARVRLPRVINETTLDKVPTWIVPLMAVLVLVICRIGVSVVFEHFALSLDEFLADFDAAIFQGGVLMARLPEEWRGYANALQPIFMLDMPKHEYWASGYLPANAYLRAAAASAHLKDWLNPTFAAVAVLSLYGIGRQLWPDHPRRALAAVVLLATSAQFLIMSMTAYAMAAHLAFNLVWLWLFLRRKPASDAAALGIGFMASGLHQVIFHPLFAGPFILELWLARSWRRAALFTLGYAALCLFWLSYWGLIFKWLGIVPETAAATASAGGQGWLMSRIAPLLERMDVTNLIFMAASLIRFMTWQNLLLVPLALVGGLAALRTNGPFRPLALGILLTVLLVAALVPTQIHGWGYRYLHGLLGSACLLAIHGWGRLSDPLAAPARRRAQAAFTAVCLVSALILIPARAWQTRQFSHPHAAAYASMIAQPTEVVLVDNGTVGFDMGSFVRNDPFLVSGRKIMLLTMLTPDQLTDLCSRHTVSVWDARNPAARGVPTFNSPGVARRAAELRAHLRAIACTA
jgi:hypothetical protein